ncbi:MAG: ParB N-terminal domain-containing protein [Candidatus Eisenbacteria bacterium]
MTRLPASEHRLPDLRFVPVEALVPHERHDARRLEPLIQRLKNEAVLKNPPIVAALAGAEGRFIVLDGANRVTAAAQAGLPHIVVQVVNYTEPHVHLSTWSHALGEMPRWELEAALRKIPGLTVHEKPNQHARALLARREALAYVAYADGGTDTLHGGADIAGQNDLLNQVVDTYRNRLRYYRVPTDEFSDADERHPGITALVVYPHFQHAEVVELATTGARLPAGITRHLIRWRALRLDVPIERLASGESLAEKNRWLTDWLGEKLAGRKVRFYEEPTVSFDE